MNGFFCCSRNRIKMKCGIWWIFYAGSKEKNGFQWNLSENLSFRGNGEGKGKTIKTLPEKKKGPERVQEVMTE